VITDAFDFEHHSEFQDGLRSQKGPNASSGSVIEMDSLLDPREAENRGIE
jgi:hypothetical protein